MTPPSSLATLMMPALMPVPSMPSSISRTYISAITSGEISPKGRGTARWFPVATMICISLPSATSRINWTSRPKSKVLTSTMVRTPSSRTARMAAMDCSRYPVPVDDFGVGMSEAGSVGADVLMAQGETQLIGINRPHHGVNSCHLPSLPGPGCMGYFITNIGGMIRGPTLATLQDCERDNWLRPCYPPKVGSMMLAKPTGGTGCAHP